MNEDLDVRHRYHPYPGSFDLWHFVQTSITFDAFLSAPSSCANAVEILHPLRLRYFSPSELLRLFHLEEIDSKKESTGAFQWATGVSMKAKYRLVGNSVNVRVVTELIEFLYEGDS
jgi:tRNA (cytosine38-C5)-methyltransferase